MILFLNKATFSGLAVRIQQMPKGQVVFIPMNAVSTPSSVLCWGSLKSSLVSRLPLLFQPKGQGRLSPLISQLLYLLGVSKLQHTDMKSLWPFPHPWEFHTSLSDGLFPGPITFFQSQLLDSSSYLLSSWRRKPGNSSLPRLQCTPRL